MSSYSNSLITTVYVEEATTIDSNSEKNIATPEPCPVVALPIKCPPSLRPILPVETLDHVLQKLKRSELLPLLRVNSMFYGVAARVLYRNVDGLQLRQSVACLQTLANTSKVASFVRFLEIGWEDAYPTENLYQLLHRVLQKLSALTALYLELPRHHAPLWILKNCNFSLDSFSTSLPCTEELAQFLDLQPGITELSLRGCEDRNLPFFSSPEILWGEETFLLSASSLPNLSQFRTIHARPSIIATIASGRPIQMASIPLFPSLSIKALCALALSSASIQRLSIMSFDPTAPDFLLPEIVKRFPDLEALHIVILLTELTHENLKASAPLLSGFKSLQYITLMAASDENSALEDERAIANLWHRWCPTLKTIILPRGKVWFEGGLDCSSV